MYESNFALSKDLFLFQIVFFIAIIAFTSAHHGGLSPFYNIFRFPIPFYHNNAESYVPVATPNLYKDQVLATYLSLPNNLPTLNILAEVPFSIKNSFTVVPLLIVSRENINFVTNTTIIGTSDKKPLMIVRTESNHLLQCTPAVKVLLERPFIVYSLKSSIVFPSEIEIVHEGYKIPVRIGTVLAPIPQDTYVSAETPVSVNVLYAVPTRPVNVDFFINNADAVSNEENESVVVETASEAPVKNVTVLNFPEVESSPELEVDEEDEELGK